MVRSLRVSMLASSALLTACAASSEPAPSSHGAELFDTIVTVRADGGIEQTTRKATAEQRKAELELRQNPSAARASAQGEALAPSTLALDSGCAAAALWIYDSTMSNRLCVASYIAYDSTDSLDLRKVYFGYGCITFDCSERPTWAGNVHYVYPGFNAGGLRPDPTWTSHFAPPAVSFDSWGPLQEVDPWNAVIVELYGPRL